MMDAGRHPNIELLTYSDVIGVSGYVGQFQVKVRQRPRYVDIKLCTGCGACVEACVYRKGVPNEFDAGLSKRRAAYIPFNGQGIPMKAVIDKETCVWLSRGKCLKDCVKACPTNAINFDQKEEIVELNVGSIVVATGFEMFDPKRLSAYSYGKSPNILDGLQFERMSSATGPTQGKILTAEGKTPERVAIIHCVGSRDEHANRYCSRVCCMYALKHAHLVRDKTGAEVFEFYMDMRAFGKDYEEFYERVQAEGVYFVRGRGAEVVVQNDGKLQVKAEDTTLGIPVQIGMDMVILETAMEAPRDSDKVASLFGISRSASGFFQEAHPKLRPFHTNTEGVFLAGACQAPKDVPDTVAHAGAAAGEVLSLLSRGQVVISPTTALVDEKLCSGCKTCIALCPYTAISFIAHNGTGVVQINEALCKGCGTCAAACPAGAITARHFTDQQIVAELEGLFNPSAMAKELALI
ncbi:heterodisulfide reductase subunit A2 [Anaerolineae bacterium]|nr:heterodisulfide reductase subunit A2 [Anaerolineae bacterium]